jgi:hypothetical protein
MSQSSTVEQAAADEAGPIDYLIFEFPTGRAEATAFTLLHQLVEQDLIHILDLEFVARGHDHTVTLVDAADAIAAADGQLDAFLGASSTLLDDEDVRHVGDLLQPGSLGAILIYENQWIVTLSRGLRHADATLMASGTIPLEEVDRALGA